MKNKILNIALLVSIFPLLTSCSIIGDIFKTGMGVGVFLVIIVIAVIFYFVNRMGKNN